MKIIVNSIQYNRSLVDGPGIRTVIFLQGCNVHCPGCHNRSSWDITKGKPIEIEDLVVSLKEQSINKKVTISGGEPLMQEEAVLELVKRLIGFNIALYTSYDYDKINPEIMQYLTYVKTGKYMKDLKTSVIPYVGSSNQIFRRIKK